jgi:DNA-binding NarL/FixJ family response regulator
MPGGTVAFMDFCRRRWRPEYGDLERDRLDMAFTNVPWLWANPEESVAQTEVESLSPQQRVVTFLLLDGLARKKIAARMSISEVTVNHHVKISFSTLVCNRSPGWPRFPCDGNSSTRLLCRAAVR